MEEARRVGPAEFTRRLLGRRSTKAVVALPLTRTDAPDGAPRMKWIAEAVKRDALGWLVREGGWRSRHVVVKGRRREGRLWDRDIFPSLGVRFTGGPLRLLVASMETHSSIPQLTRKARSVVQAGAVSKTPATGDLLALHRLVTSLEAALHAGRRRVAQAPRGAECPKCGQALEVARAAKPPERCPKCNAALAAEDLSGWGQEPKAQAKRLRELIDLSPLTLAFRPELAGAGAKNDEDAVAKAAAAFAPLFVGDRSVLFTYLDEALAREWLRAEERRRHMGPQEAQASYAATTNGLLGLIRAAKDRPEALRPIIAFFRGYVMRRFGNRAQVFETLQLQAQGFNRASEREGFMRAVGRLFSLGRVVAQAADEALEAPYVERTESQKVLLADYHERFKAVGQEVEAIRRELVGEIG